jgi:hypothetical protein
MPETKTVTGTVTVTFTITGTDGNRIPFPYFPVTVAGPRRRPGMALGP